MDGNECLWVVMPAYNEQANIETVIGEWLLVLRADTRLVKFLVVDDGSGDQTGALVRSMAQRNPEVELMALDRTYGHGMACLNGYLKALDCGADWVFQIDSDGQCDPVYFQELWCERHQFANQFGNRVLRHDGWSRKILSYGLSFLCLVRCQIWLKDPNVPYRLMRADLLAEALANFPDFDLANVLLTIRLNRIQPIKWRPISFRARYSGRSSLKLRSLPIRAIRLWRGLKRANVLCDQFADTR